MVAPVKVRKWADTGEDSQLILHDFPFTDSKLLHILNQTYFIILET